METCPKRDSTDIFTTSPENYSWTGTPSLTDVIMEGEPGFDILNLIKGRYINDQFFKSIMEKPNHFKDFKIEDDLIFIILNGR